MTGPSLDLEAAAHGIEVDGEALTFREIDLGFLDIARCCRAVLSAHDYESRPTLERLMALDAWARQEVSSWTT